MALILGTNLLESPVKHLDIFYDITSLCDENMCTISIPYEYAPQGCYLVEKMAAHLHAEYECDVKSVLDIRELEDTLFEN